MDPPARFRARFPAEPRGLAAIRGEAVAAASACGLTGDALERMRLGVSEAATNVVLHAYPDGASLGAIELTLYEEAGGVTVVVADDGAGMKPRADSPGLGVGLPMIASVADRFEIVNRDVGSELRMTFLNA